MGWLLRLLVGEADRRAIDSDLSELHDFRRRRDGADAADRWLRRQRRLYPWVVLLDHGRAALPGWTTMQHLWRDVRYTLRSLAAVPALSATIVLTVGVGLGATVAMLVLDQDGARRSAALCGSGTPGLDLHRQPAVPISLLGRGLSGPRARPPTFSAVAAYQRLQVTVADGDAAERVPARAVTGSYLSAAGPEAAHRPALRCLRRCPRRSDRRVDLRLLGPAFRWRSLGAGPRDDHRRGARHRRRRAAADVRSARARHRRVLAGPLADTDSERVRSSSRCSAACAPACRRRRRRKRLRPPTPGSFRSGGLRSRTRRRRGGSWI